MGGVVGGEDGRAGGEGRVEGGLDAGQGGTGVEGEEEEVRAGGGAVEARGRLEDQGLGAAQLDRHGLAGVRGRLDDAGDRDLARDLATAGLREEQREGVPGGEAVLRGGAVVEGHLGRAGGERAGEDLVGNETRVRRQVRQQREVGARGPRPLALRAGRTLHPERGGAVGVGLGDAVDGGRVLGGGGQRGGVVREDHEVRGGEVRRQRVAEGGGGGGPHKEGGGEEHDPDRDRQQHREVAARLVTDLGEGESQHQRTSPVSAAETDSGVGRRTSPAIRPSASRTARSA